MELRDLQTLFPKLQITEVSLDDDRVKQFEELDATHINDVASGNIYFVVNNPKWVARRMVPGKNNSNPSWATLSLSQDNELFQSNLKGTALNQMHLREISGTQQISLHTGNVFLLAGKKPANSKNKTISNKEEINMAEPIQTPGGLPPLPNQGANPIPTPVNEVAADVLGGGSAMPPLENAGETKETSKKPLSDEEKEKRRKAAEQTRLQNELANKFFAEVEQVVSDGSEHFREAVGLLSEHVRALVAVTPDERSYTISSVEVFPSASESFTPEAMQELIITDIFNQKITEGTKKAEFLNGGKFPVSSHSFVKSTIDIKAKPVSVGSVKGIFVSNMAPFLEIAKTNNRNLAKADVDTITAAVATETVAFHSVAEITKVMTFFRQDIIESDKVAINGKPAKLSIDLNYKNKDYAQLVENAGGNVKVLKTKLVRVEDGNVVRSIITERNHLPINIRETIDLMKDPISADKREKLTRAYFGNYSQTVPLNAKKSNLRASKLLAKIKRLSPQGASILDVSPEGVISAVIFSEAPADRKIASLFPVDSAGVPILPAACNIPDKSVEPTGKGRMRANSYSLTSTKFVEDAEYRAQTSISLPRYSGVIEAVGKEMFSDTSQVAAMLRTATDKKKANVNVYSLFETIQKRQAGKI